MYVTADTLLLFFLHDTFHRKNPVKLFEDPTSIVCVYVCACVCVRVFVPTRSCACVHTQVCMNSVYLHVLLLAEFFSQKSDSSLFVLGSNHNNFVIGEQIVINLLHH